METRKEVKTFIVNYTCDDCNIGLMVPTGEVYMVYPALYQHICNHCKAEKKFNAHYPATVLEEVTTTTDKGE